ncbi:ribosome recycling factor [Candidatus Azambacteria bacterium]|nr:ribosome recycling factor [Candidatus Azambacteria bacterium]
MHQSELKHMREQMEKTVEHFKSETASLRTGRASPALVEGIVVEYYGQTMPLVQVASISSPSSQMLVIQPWDKNALEPIQKAILQSPLGIAPIVDKDIIRLTLPSLTEERRAGLIKLLDQKVEEARIAIRQEREDAMRKVQKMKEEGTLREDDFFKVKTEIQKIVDEFNNDKIKMLRDKKEKEIMTV